MTFMSTEEINDRRRIGFLEAKLNNLRGEILKAHSGLVQDAARREAVPISKELAALKDKYGLWEDLDDGRVASRGLVYNWEV